MRALISVYDKTGILELASELIREGYEILSSGGTYTYLKNADVEAIEVSEVTGFREILGGRVKTLHPVIHGTIKKQ
jgi:phosphoribosylaminoimidazolecarboxamide formyltransferase/IMP cyclohydrolase